MNPLVSILIANYENSIFFDDLFESIFQQTYENWEIIFVDDNSKDKSINHVQKYKDKRIKIFINEKNYGTGFTKKKACDIANGEILMFLDPDDAIAKDAIEVMVKAHGIYPNASLIYSTHYVCDDKLEPKYINMDSKSLQRDKTNLEEDVVSHLASFKKRHYEIMEPLDTNLKAAVDKDLYYKLEEVGDLNYINKPLYYYRRHEKGISQSNSKFVAKMSFEVFKEAYKRRKLINNKKISFLVYLKRKSMYYYLYSLIMAFEEKNNCREYYFNIVKSIFWAPWFRLIYKLSLLFVFTPLYTPLKNLYKKYRMILISLGICP